MKTLFLSALLTAGLSAHAAAKPLKILLITGGCCHDYNAQTEILKKGIEERINAQVTQLHVDDGSTKPALPIFGHPDYAKGYDLVIHDECAADMKDVAIVKGVLKPHVDGLPAVNLHCAMHSYRTGKFDQKVEKPGDDGSLWFEFLGLQSSGHTPQHPIKITYTKPNHPIVKGLENWTTINEELYNNLAIFKQAEPLATGVQEGEQERVVAWTNLYGPKKTRVFCTTIGHNNETVADGRYLDLVTRGILWAVHKLDASGKPAAGYAAPKR